MEPKLPPLPQELRPHSIEGDAALEYAQAFARAFADHELERAAQACEAMSDAAEEVENDEREAGCYDCAEAIRALIQPKAQKKEE